MNKNIIIGSLVAVVILILGYAAFKNTSDLSNTDLAKQTASTTDVTSSNDSNVNTSDTSTPSPASKTPALPGVETSREVTISNSTALVSGKIKPNGLPTAYWYEYGVTTAVSLARTSKQNIGGGYNQITSPAFISGLKANTQYYFRLNAENNLGVSQGSVFGFVTNSTTPTPGKVPSVQTTSVTNIARTGAIFNASVNPNGFSTSWWFEFGETTSLGSLTGFAVTNNGQTFTSVSATVNDLKPLTKYYYRVNAQNQYGTTNGTIGSFTTSGPAASSAPTVKTNTATNISTSSATLNAQLDPHGADTIYWFEYTKDSLLGKVLGTNTIDTITTSEQAVNGADTSTGVKTNISNLSRNTKYYYRIFARNQYSTVVGSVIMFRTK